MFGPTHTLLDCTCVQAWIVDVDADIAHCCPLLHWGWGWVGLGSIGVWGLRVLDLGLNAYAGKWRTTMPHPAPPGPSPRKVEGNYAPPPPRPSPRQVEGNYAPPPPSPDLRKVEENCAPPIPSPSPRKVEGKLCPIQPQPHPQKSRRKLCPARPLSRHGGGFLVSRGCLAQNRHVSPYKNTPGLHLCPSLDCRRGCRHGF